MRKMDNCFRTKLHVLCVRLLAVCTLSLMTMTGFAQTKAVTGTVTDSSGAPIAGASVFLPGSTIGTVTDASGAFSLSNVPENATLSVSFLGYVGQDVPVTGRTSIQISLQEDSESLEEVVVIGYGTSKRSNTVGSIARLSSADMADRPIARVENALQGQMAGVSVRSTTGKPGADLEIRVRGAASINGESSPLYVVDGVPVQSLQSVNPNDIESIDVLKDAASAAIYGSRGSNGVVLITTKRGKSGAPVIQFSAYTGIATVESKVDVMDSEEWLAFNKKWYDRQWVLSGSGRNASDSQDVRIAQAVADGKLNLSGLAPGTDEYRKALDPQKQVYGLYDPWWGTNKLEAIDWQDTFFEAAPMSDMQLSISGATDRINYLISGGVFMQDGIVPGSSFNRYTGRANLNVKVNEWIKVGISLAPSYSLSYGTNVDGKDLAVSRVLAYPGWVLPGTGKWAGADPSHYLKEYDSTNLSKYKFYGEWGAGVNNVGPYVQAVGPYRKEDNMRLNSSFDMTLNLAKGLSVTGMYSWNYRSAQDRSYTPTWMSTTWDTAAYVGQRSNSSYRTWVSNSNLAQVVANYNAVFGDDHALDLMAGASQETFGENTSHQQRSDFPNDKTWAFNNSYGNTTNYNEIDYSSNAMVSYFGRATYTFKDRYILAASFRRDGSSKFGPGNRWGDFPSVSAAWKFSEEPFMQAAGSWLGPSKLRVSWGLAGNDRIRNASFLSSMTARNYSLAGTTANGYVVGSIANSMLGWEQTSSTNVGLDLSFLRGRISLSTDYYYKMTSNLLLDSPISAITGFTSMMDNIGKVKNWGMEFDLTSHNITRPNFTWNTSLNVSFNRNEITELAGGNTDIIFGNTVNALIQRVGQPINSYYLLEVERILRESDFNADGTAKVPIMGGQGPGDAKWKDNDGSGTITPADRAVVGSLQPDFEWGMTNNFTYKNWDLSIFINGRQGGTLLSSGSRSWNRGGSSPNWVRMDQWLHKAYWSEEEPGDGKVPAFFAITTSNQYDTNWLYDATYLRIKNIQLGYNWNLKPNKFVKNIRLYVSCDNVYLWDNYYPGWSPEGATQDNAAAEWGAYPLARTLIGGVNITF